MIRVSVLLHSCICILVLIQLVYSHFSVSYCCGVLGIAGDYNENNIFYNCFFMCCVFVLFVNLYSFSIFSYTIVEYEIFVNANITATFKDT